MIYLCMLFCDIFKNYVYAMYIQIKYLNIFEIWIKKHMISNFTIIKDILELEKKIILYVLYYIMHIQPSSMR